MEPVTEIQFRPMTIEKSSIGDSDVPKSSDGTGENNQKTDHLSMKYVLICSCRAHDNCRQGPGFVPEVARLPRSRRQASAFPVCGVPPYVVPLLAAKAYCRTPRPKARDFPCARGATAYLCLAQVFSGNLPMSPVCTHSLWRGDRTEPGSLLLFPVLSPYGGS